MHESQAQRASGRALTRLLGAAVLALLVLAALVQGGCGSLSIEDVRARTLALDKNAPFAAALETRTLADGRELLAAHFPAEEGRAEEGREGRAPIVLVHGTPDTMGSWGALLFGAGDLAGRADVWTIEVLGHGMAGGRGDGVDFQRCAEFVASAIEALGLSGVTLVGNSYGGEFCWRAALDRPDLVGRLVLIDSSGLFRTEEQFLSEERKLRNWGYAARLGYLLNSEDRIASALDPHFPGGADDERVREVWLGMENRGNWNAMVDLARDEDGERQDELAELEMPVLLVFGQNDLAYPPETFGAEFERRIPSAKLHVIEGAGHYPHEQAPARVAELLLEFTAVSGSEAPR